MQQLNNLRVDDIGEVAENHKDGDEAHGGGGDQGQEGVDAGGRQGSAVPVISVTSSLTSLAASTALATDGVIVEVNTGTGRSCEARTAGCYGPWTGACLWIDIPTFGIDVDIFRG